MKLLELIITNFMPFKGKQAVTFPQHETQNVMLLFGDNMRGKTSFLNSIRWGFYGIAVGRHLRSISRVNLINIESAAENDWSMSIEIKFSHEGKNYEIKRFIQKKSHISRPKHDSDFEENIGLRVDGQVITGDIVSNEINQVIPEEISRFFLFDGELLQEYENLLIEESEQGEKIKEHIEQALGVPALVHGREEFNLLLKNARRIQARDAKNNTDIKSYGEQQRQLEIKLVSYEKDLIDLKEQKCDVQNKIDDIDDELKNTEIVQKRKIEMEGLKSDQKNSEIQLLDLGNDKRTLIQTAWKDVLSIYIQPTLGLIKEKRDILQSSLSDKAVLDAQIKNLLKTLVDPTCPTCKQDIPDLEMQNIQETIASLQAKSELTVVDYKDIATLNEKFEKLSKIKSSDEGLRINEIVNKQRKLQVGLIRIETKIDEIEEEIKEYDTDQIMRQREMRDRYTGQLGRVNDDIDKRKIEIDKNVSQQDHIATLISKSAGGQGQLSSIRVNLYQNLEEVFTKSIEQLRDSLREQVASYASKAFEQLTTEKTYKGLEINNNYGLSIIDQKGRILKERSAGAEQIVALSLIDGLNRTARKSGPIIMDTPLGRLDPKHRNNVLKYLPNMAEQVILLVHEGEIDPQKDLQNLAERIGGQYKIERVSATESQILRG